MPMHLGITKQATGELVQHLVYRGHLVRAPDPTDRRARLLVLTECGHDCTRSAQAAAAARTVDRWEQGPSPAEVVDLRTALVSVAGTGHLRPTW